MIFSFIIHKTFLKDFQNPCIFIHTKGIIPYFFQILVFFHQKPNGKLLSFPWKKKLLPEKYTFFGKNIWRTVTLTEKINHPIL